MPIIRIVDVIAVPIPDAVRNRCVSLCVDAFYAVLSDDTVRDFRSIFVWQPIMMMMWTLLFIWMFSWNLQVWCLCACPPEGVWSGEFALCFEPKDHNLGDPDSV